MRGFGWFFGLIGAMCLIGSGAAALTLDGDLPLVVKGAGGLGVALMVVWVAVDWTMIQDYRNDQTSARSLNATVATLLGFAIAVTANVAAHGSTWRWDATKNKQYTLSGQSVDLVKKLDRQVELLAFFTKGSPEQKNFETLMEQYAANSSQLKVEYHDPAEEPLLAEKENITSEGGTVILRAGSKEKRIEYTFDESSITNALILVTSDAQHKVCVVGGHGEMDPEDGNTQAGFGYAKDKLEAQNYTVTKITLTETAPSPATCEVVILAAPQTEVLPAELDRLAQYVAAGGALIALLDPSVPLSVANDFARYGIKVGDDVVIETSPYRMMQNNPFGLIIDQASYEQHPLTAKLSGNSVLFLARSVGVGGEVAGVTVKELARTSEQSWGESDYQDQAAEPAPTEGRDRIGKVPVMAVAEVQDPANIRTKTEVAVPVTPDGLPAVPVAPTSAAPELPRQAGGKVVVVGDMDFASNQLVANGLNQDLLLNTVAWMAGEEDQIGIRPNEAAKGKLEMSTMGLLLCWLVSLVLMPGAMIIGAIGTYVYRRRL